MKFYYKGTKNNEIVTGFIDAANEEEASFLLLDEDVNITELKSASVIELSKEKLNEIGKKYSKVKLSDLIVFTRQFATLFSSGIPVIVILKRLYYQAVNPKLKESLEKIYSDVEAGSSLSNAFSRHTEIFSPLYINMLHVGEEGGVLDIVLDRLANILETDLETKNRIKTATRYPKMVVGSIVIAFIILITFVIPKFVNLFAKFNTELPLPTRILIGINNFTVHYWWIVLIIIILLVIAYKKAMKTEQGKYTFDKMIFKIPIIGKLIHKIYLSRVSRILGLLYQSGIAITTSFEIVSEVSGNLLMKEDILKINSNVSMGKSLAAAFEESEYFPLVVADMISAGEETGKLDEMLFKIADYYDQEIDYSIKTLSAAIEPILLVFIAAMVMLLALGVFLPMWDMIKVFK
jgi:type II secretory pathway component PulF